MQALEWGEHLDELAGIATNGHVLGYADEDAVLNQLVDIALGSPATCALRALSRIAPGLALDDEVMLTAATQIGMGFRTLFNQAETQALLKNNEDGFYWHAVLRYCAEHDLQSVLDEYVHVLLEAEGLADTEPRDALPPLAEKIAEALSLHPARIDVSHYCTGWGKIRDDSFNMRGRFAMRLVPKGEDETGAQRTGIVRTAFNSPFRPFVLASTSVGQEGLDFHPYCHRVVHWNLPSNPVDLEQREGRIHRYKNHAVRLNLAAAHHAAIRAPAAGPDPWAAMFKAAHAEASREGDLEPFWLLDGDTKVERHVLSLPFSKETSLLAWLKRSVALYRLAFGQPRQDDLLSYLHQLDDQLSDRALGDLQISLRPEISPPTSEVSPSTALPT